MGSSEILQTNDSGTLWVSCGDAIKEFVGAI